MALQKWPDRWVVVLESAHEIFAKLPQMLTIRHPISLDLVGIKMVESLLGIAFCLL